MNHTPFSADEHKAGLLDDYIAQRTELARALKLVADQAWAAGADHDALDAEIRLMTQDVLTLKDIVCL